jgi:hypothetical protein
VEKDAVFARPSDLIAWFKETQAQASAAMLAQIKTVTKPIKSRWGEAL